MNLEQVLQFSKEIADSEKRYSYPLKIRRDFSLSRHYYSLSRHYCSLSASTFAFNIISLNKIDY